MLETFQSEDCWEKLRCQETSTDNRNGTETDNVPVGDDNETKQTRQQSRNHHDNTMTKHRQRQTRTDRRRAQGHTGENY